MVCARVAKMQCRHAFLTLAPGALGGQPKLTTPCGSSEPMSTLHDRLRGFGLNHIVLIALLCALLAIAGCASKPRTGAASAELLRSGWRNATALAPAGNFDDYIRSIEGELRAHRVAFNPAQSERELTLVAPFRQAPEASCGAPRGIAVLVHGLSDTAFAMRDLANSFARHCFEARALLLPGHGTRAADLLGIDHNDWRLHVNAAVEQAAHEHETVVVAGFSLGAVLALSAAAELPDRVDGVIGLSPAYRLRAGTLARQAGWLARLRPWLDEDPREEFARYEAMPTRGIASTMAALNAMHCQVRARGVPMPWLMVQSADDEVVHSKANLDFFERRADNARSTVLSYFSDPAQRVERARVQWLNSADTELRVAGLSHLAVHIAPDNPQYGVNGSFRNCGSAPYRDAVEIHACREAAQVWYGVGGQRLPPGQAGARATFNPHYVALERRIGAFLAELASSTARPIRSAP